MAKPATVEEETCKPKHSKRPHKLRVVASAASAPLGKVSAPTKASRPEAADDPDDMWDNVPV